MILRPLGQAGIFLGLVSVAAASVISSCKPPARPGALEIEVLGCAAVERGAALACELGPDAKLRVALAGPAPRVTSRGRPLESNTSRLHQRTVVEIAVPRDTPSLTIESGSDSPKVAEVAVTFAPSRPWLDEARKKREGGDLAAAALTGESKLAGGDETERALAQSLLARVDLARGEIANAKRRFKDAIARHRALGRVSDALDDGFALSFTLVQRSRDYAEARALLNGLEPLAARVAEGRARLPYYRASLEAEVGDRRAALGLLEESERRARELGLSRLERNARNARAVSLEVVGRRAEARAILTELESTAEAAGASRCDRADVAINAGYGALREAEAARARGRRSEPLLRDARRELERAVELTRDERCPDPHLRAVALGNLAFALFRAREFTGARATLAEARRSTVEPRGTEALFWLELDALLDLEEEAGDPKLRLARAAESFRKAHAEAERLVLMEAEWSALTGLGAALAKAGKPTEAVRAFQRAEGLLDELALLVPLGTGRGTFLRDRRESELGLIDLHLAAGETAAALDAARRGRVRVLASVRAALRAERLSKSDRERWEAAVGAYRSARDDAETSRGRDWTRSAEVLAAEDHRRKARESRVSGAVDEALAALGVRRERSLPALPHDATTILLHYARESVWLFVARPPAKVVAKRLGGSDQEGTALREAVSAELASPLFLQARLRVLSDLAGIDPGAVPTPAGPLGERVAIEHSLDLGEAGPSGSSASSASSVLVVADPTSDLPAAAREGDEVAGVLRAIGATNVNVLRGDGATTPRVRTALEQASFFHYAGHAVHAGHEGWESHLRLAGGARLELADILTLAHAPLRVVLSSCESAGSTEAETTSSFGLAQAFVVAGSSAVLAPVRPVKDSTVAALAVVLARELLRRDRPIADALRASLAQATAVAPEDRWAFRLVRP